MSLVQFKPRPAEAVETAHFPATTIKLAEVRAARRKASHQQRQDRRERWRAAFNQLEYFRALRHLSHCASLAARYGVPGAELYAGLDEGPRLLRSLREAEARWLLTPAPDQNALNEKRRFRASEQFPYTPVNAGAVDCLITADEKWLLANAPRRRKAVRS